MLPFLSSIIHTCVLTTNTHTYTHTALTKSVHVHTPMHKMNPPDPLGGPAAPCAPPPRMAAPPFFFSSSSFSPMNGVVPRAEEGEPLKYKELAAATTTTSTTFDQVCLIPYSCSSPLKRWEWTCAGALKSPQGVLLRREDGPEIDTSSSSLDCSSPLFLMLFH